MNVAQTILEQLGGNRFIAMTGAKDFVGSIDELRFRIPRSNGATVVVVTLKASDLYRVTFGRIGRQNGAPAFIALGEVDHVYADQLAAVFTSRTGLDTRL